MNQRLKNCVLRLDPAAIVFVAIPALLYLPVLYYSLDTPFGMADDYDLWWLSYNISDRFYGWLSIEFFGYDYDQRHRPFYEFYPAVAFKVFGPTPWLHHLALWAMHFCAVAAFAAAFLCFQRRSGNADGIASPRLIRLLPLTALVYLWIFFPNQPAARLGTAEPYSVFFLGVCVWMTALTLLRQGKPQSRRSTLLIYAAFCVGFCGLAWSKETNIAPALYLLVSYYALPAIAALRRRQADPRISAVRALKSVGVWKALGGLPLIAIFLHTLVKVSGLSQMSEYYSVQLTPELLASNAAWIAEGLFQLQTSLIIAAGLALLSAALLLFVAVNIAKRRFTDELVFTLFLLGLFASLYLTLLIYPVQYQNFPAIRYWHILISVFTTLLAFAAKFILESAAESIARFNYARISIRPRNLAAYALTAFIAFFICCNYYNFLYQTVVQRIACHNEANLIAEITRILDRGSYVHILSQNGYFNEHARLLYLYYDKILPRLYGKEYNVHIEPPQEAGQPHYIVRRSDSVAPTQEMEENYRPLTYAYYIADLLQSGRPYKKRDENADIRLWHIYDDEVNRIWQNGEALHIRHLVAEAGEPLIRSDFDVYLSDRRLIYLNERCDAATLDNTFFLAAFPVNNDDLLEKRRQHGFDNLQFDFADYGFGGGERCLALRDLPEYPIKRIYTGQFIVVGGDFHHTWEGEAVLSNE